MATTDYNGNGRLVCKALSQLFPMPSMMWLFAIWVTCETLILTLKHLLCEVSPDLLRLVWYYPQDG